MVRALSQVSGVKMSDNFSFDMTGVSLPLALQVAFEYVSWSTGWADLPRNVEDASGKGYMVPRLLLFWCNPETSKVKGYNRFICKSNAAEVSPMVEKWLRGVEYGPEPDHDGTNAKGWRVYNENWGHVAGMWEAFAAIEPAWLMYGK